MPASAANPVYDKIGVTYNTTRRSDPYLTSRLYQLLDVEPNGLYLDIGCGTGNYTKALADLGLDICGVDPSETMLSEARRNAPQIEWKTGKAENIPYPDQHFDGGIATLTTHHWQDIKKGFIEVNRVLKPGSRLVVFTATPEQMNGYWLHHYFPRMLKHSTATVISVKELEEIVVKAGFRIAATEKYFVRPDLQDLFLHAGKDNPELYFREEIRKGISTFALHSVQDEVMKGLAQLREDIDTGRFQEVRKKYENDEGDYLFVVLERG